MKALRKYLWGFVIGICFEYLLRVQISIYPILIIGLGILIIILDEDINK